MGGLITWLDLARKEMAEISDGCTELTCIHHGQGNRRIYDEHRITALEHERG